MHPRWLCCWELPARLQFPFQLWQVCLCCQSTPSHGHTPGASPAQTPLHCCRTRFCDHGPPDPERSNTLHLQLLQVGWDKVADKVYAGRLCKFLEPVCSWSRFSELKWKSFSHNYSMGLSFSDLSQNFRACDFCPIRSILALFRVFYGFRTNVLQYF